MQHDHSLQTTLDPELETDFYDRLGFSHIISAGTLWSKGQWSIKGTGMEQDFWEAWIKGRWLNGVKNPLYITEGAISRVSQRLRTKHKLPVLWPYIGQYLLGRGVNNSFGHVWLDGYGCGWRDTAKIQKEEQRWNSYLKENVRLIKTLRWRCDDRRFTGQVLKRSIWVLWKAIGKRKLLFNGTTLSALALLISCNMTEVRQIESDTSKLVLSGTRSMKSVGVGGCSRQILKSKVIEEALSLEYTRICNKKRRKKRKNTSKAAILIQVTPASKAVSEIYFGRRDTTSVLLGGS